METLHTNCFGITITFNPKNKGNATLVSHMKEPDLPENKAFNSAVDGIESLVLAQFCAGIDITSNAFKESIETAYEAIGNNIDKPDVDNEIKEYKKFVIDCSITEDVFENDMISWRYPVSADSTLSILIEKDGKFDIGFELDTSTLALEDTLEASVDTALSLLDETKSVIQHWRRNVFSPLTLREDTIDFWYQSEQGEVEDTLTVPWVIQQQGKEAVGVFIHENLKEYADYSFTQTW